MNAGILVILDNLDYLLWGRLAAGQPGGVLLTLLMALGAAILALPGGILLAALAWRYPGWIQKGVVLWAELIRGIPLIFVIFWLWYLLPLITGGDLPGALTVTFALAWFTAAAVMHSVLGHFSAPCTARSRQVSLPQALPRR
jgi:polar amino acid transport system permease protein